MKKETLIFIQHILDSIEKIEKFMQGVNEKDFYKDEKLQDAIVRRIEVIGEAVKNIPIGFRNKYSNIPWIKIAGMRDKLMHHYFGINLKTVWKVIEKDIPKLKREIKKIMEREGF